MLIAKNAMWPALLGVLRVHYIVDVSAEYCYFHIARKAVLRPDEVITYDPGELRVERVEYHCLDFCHADPEPFIETAHFDKEARRD